MSSYIEYSENRGEREPRTVQGVRNVSEKIALGQDLKREWEIARKASKMKTFQAEKTTYARAKRHEGAGISVGTVVVYNVMATEYGGEKLERRQGREAGTHVYATMGFGICPIGNLVIE